MRERRGHVRWSLEGIRALEEVGDLQLAELTARPIALLHLRWKLPNYAIKIARPKIGD